jgi:predicted nucleotide-binding protein
MRPTKEEAIARLRRVLDEVPDTPAGTYPWEIDLDITDLSEGFSRWQRNARMAMAYIFGEGSRQAGEFSEINYQRYLDEQMWFSFNEAIELIESMIDEIEEYGLPTPQTQTIVQAPENGTAAVSARVFVVHGSNEGTRDMVARFLDGLALEPVILEEQANRGRTIIEKFEDYAQTVEFAVAICTPDDVGALATEADNLKPRMRQNVVLELGYFAGKVGRKRVCALVKGDIETPSDYDGVIYIDIDDGVGWKLELARELNAAGLTIDMDGLL